MTFFYNEPALIMILIADWLRAALSTLMHAVLHWVMSAPMSGEGAVWSRREGPLLLVPSSNIDWVFEQDTFLG